MLQRFLPLCIVSVVLVTMTAVVCAQTPATRGTRGTRPATIPNQLRTFEKNTGFELLFDGLTIDPEIWQGAIDKWKIEDGAMVCSPGGNLLTKKEYKDFVLRFEYKLPPGGNNGVGIRTKLDVDAAYNGGEVQILDNKHEKYDGRLRDDQKNGALYRMVPPTADTLRPIGEWNVEEIIVFGNHIRVRLNGTVITDADFTDFAEGKRTPFGGKPHVFNEKGFVGFLGHNDPVEFRSVRIKEIDEAEYKNLLTLPNRNRPQQ